MKLSDILSSMSMEAKIKLCDGADFWHSKAMPQYGIPAFTMSDGPHGLRCRPADGDMFGLNDSIPATCFPSAVTAGASWNEELFAAEGRAIGEEASANGVDMVLGPACNIKRNPLCGRNFEYLSEDPCHAGRLAAAYVRGQQGVGVFSCLKHFAANSQEYKRMNGDSQVDERALREIYLAAFEYAVKNAKPAAIMCAYNKINGVHCSDNKKLLGDILRDEWGFDGLVVTDWGGMNDRVAAFRAGCDLNMPGGSGYMERAVLKSVRNGELPEKYIDACAARVIKTATEAKKHKKRAPFDVSAHDELACRIAEQGAVLLKNEGELLPLKREDITLFGDMAANPRYQGAGSSHINPTCLDSLCGALPDAAYFACCAPDGSVSEDELRKAVKAAKGAKAAVVAAGLPESYESEGFDRENMSMPHGHCRMIEAIAAANPNTVVVLYGGAPMELPWIDSVRAVLFMGLPGQAGGRACANLLTGKANPCGKLTESWPVSYNDVVSRNTFGTREVEYRESIYVGYRYYDKAGVALRFPFGHGLSYTQFEYENIRLDGMTLSFTVRNAGSVRGAEVAQLYVAPPQDGLHRPIRELRDFARVELEAGESRDMSFELTPRAFAVRNGKWVVPSGRYTLLVGSSDRDIRLSCETQIEGEDVPVLFGQESSWYCHMNGMPTRMDWALVMDKLPKDTAKSQKGEFTMDNSCDEMKGSSLVMRLQYKLTEALVRKSYGGKNADAGDPAFRMMLSGAVDCPMRVVTINTSGKVGENIARGLLHMANGRFFKGLATMLSPK